MGARFRIVGREEKGLAHLLVLLAGREEMEVRQEPSIWQHSRTDEDMSQIRGRDVWAPSQLLLPRVFIAGGGPDEDLVTQMRASRIRDADTDTDVDAGGRREPGAGSDGVAAVLGGGSPAPWSHGGCRCW